MLARPIVAVVLATLLSLSLLAVAIAAKGNVKVEWTDWLGIAGVLAFGATVGVAVLTAFRRAAVEKQALKEEVERLRAEVAQLRRDVSGA